MKIDIQCGDIILFSRPCLGMDILSSATCFAAKASSVSIYDHLGVVVEDINTKKLHLLEANAGGVSLHPLEERLKRTKASEIAIRKLHHDRNPSFKKELWELASKRNGLPYNRSMFQMSTAMIQSYINSDDSLITTELAKLNCSKSMLNNEIKSLHFANQSLTHLLLKIRHDQIDKLIEEFKDANTQINSTNKVSPKSSPVEAYYCSQLVAEVLLQLDVIVSPSRRAEDYIPADFSSRTTAKNLHANNLLFDEENASTSQCHFSPDLVVTSPRNMTLHIADSVYTIDASRVKHVHVDTDDVQKARRKPSSLTNHEWQLTTNDMMSPQILGQLPHLHTSNSSSSSSGSASTNHLEVVQGSVDVLVSSSQQQGKNTRHLRTVGILPPGTYSLHKPDAHHNSTLSTLTERHGADHVHLRAREKSTLRIAPPPAAPGQAAPPTQQTRTVHYSLAPQVLHEIAIGLIPSPPSSSSSPSLVHLQEQFVSLEDLLAVVTSRGGSERRSRVVLELHTLLKDLLPANYLKSAPSDSVGQVNLGLLCEVDSLIVEGQSAVQIAELLSRVSGNKELSGLKMVDMINNMISRYQEERLVVTETGKKQGLAAMSLLGLFTLRGVAGDRNSSGSDASRSARNWDVVMTNKYAQNMARRRTFSQNVRVLCSIGKIPNSNSNLFTRVSRVLRFIK